MNTLKSALVTGASRGIGLALVQEMLNAGYDKVIGLSRTKPPINDSRFSWLTCDLASPEPIDLAVTQALISVDQLVLNAGIIGPVAPFDLIGIDTLSQVMQVNVYSCKKLIDFYLATSMAPQQIVAITSGAGSTAIAGWGSYCISKAALNMMIRVYAAEHPEVHFSLLEPGVVATDMQAQIQELGAGHSFPIVKKLAELNRSGKMPQATEVADSILQGITVATAQPSGSVIDSRLYRRK